MTDSGPIPPEPSPAIIPPAAAPVPPAASPIPPAGAPAPAGVVYSGPAPSADDKTMGMLAHLLGILGFVGPLIIWLIKKDTSPFVNDQGKESLNFQLTMLIGWVVGSIANFAFCIGTLVWIAVMVVSLIFCIMGAMKAKDGVAYRYPFAIRFIK